MNRIIIILILLISYNLKAQDISNGNKIESDQINQKLNQYKENFPSFGYAPLGTIIAFHKNFNNHLTGGSQDYSNSNVDSNYLNIPDGWASCDGSQISVEQNGPLDPDGDGQFTLPDLNNQVYSPGKGRYLRGGNVSGLLNESTAWDDNGNKYTASGDGPYYGAAFGVFLNTETHSSISSYSSSVLNPNNFRFQVESMTVVYIMRVK
jgi:hypothetical protein